MRIINLNSLECKVAYVYFLLLPARIEVLQPQVLRVFPVCCTHGDLIP